MLLISRTSSSLFSAELKPKSDSHCEPHLYLEISNDLILFDLCVHHCARYLGGVKGVINVGVGVILGVLEAKLKYPDGFERLKKKVPRNILCHGILGNSWIFKLGSHVDIML